jgi:hypothetical protein
VNSADAGSALGGILSLAKAFFLKDLFRAGAYTDHFISAFDQLVPIAKAEGVDVNTIDAIPI